ncbi:phosphate signaling complex protein PhoU [Aquisediminimonas sediminicola]|uniref:phosphate signaling complex protein PhoU n=1 Tax=Alteraquisediminimonas sediminicola TaxID=2676787 RepID=UPI001C8EDC9A|nr:phosphate signaling complex protein PhoU [Aquisediminimonas sediminicola]
MPSNTGHTVKAFDEELGQLRALISEMGGLAEQAINQAMQALTRRDNDAAMRVVENDHRIDALEMEVERLAVRLIALRAPMADDLREVVAAMKIAGVVERIGDYAKNIAKRVPQFAEAKDIGPLAILPEMGKMASEMVRTALDAFAARSPEQAQAVVARDTALDTFYNSVFRALLTYMMENPHNITPCAHLLFMAKNLERVGDHATNIGEMVYFAATGAHLAERVRGGDLDD